jgi:hypothetical protein
MIRYLVLMLLLAGGVYQAWPAAAVRHAPGVLAPRDPVQTPATGAPSIEHRGFHLVPLARFEAEARVLSTERYWLFREASLSPIDLALGWGPMSDQQVIDQLQISQGNRFYHYGWRAAAPPLPVSVMVEHSANMHMIPASPDVWAQLKAVRPGFVVRFQGFLVSARKDDGWRWDSSLSRKDSGPGACELVWVETLSFTRR